MTVECDPIVIRMFQAPFHNFKEEADRGISDYLYNSSRGQPLFTSGRKRPSCLKWSIFNDIHSSTRNAQTHGIISMI